MSLSIAPELDASLEWFGAPQRLAAQDSTLYLGNNASGQQCWAFELGHCVLHHLTGSGKLQRLPLDD